MKKLLTMFVATLFLVACNTDKSAKCSASTKCDANTNVSICTFNIMIQGQKPYIKKDGTDLSWNKRLPLIASFVKTNDFDVIGCQEPIPAQVEDVKKALANRLDSLTNDLLTRKVSEFLKKENNI